jgi:hypothetical protein
LVEELINLTRENAVVIGSCNVYIVVFFSRRDEFASAAQRRLGRWHRASGAEPAREPAHGGNWGVHTCHLQDPVGGPAGRHVARDCLPRQRRGADPGKQHSRFCRHPRCHFEDIHERPRAPLACQANQRRRRRGGLVRESVDLRPAAVRPSMARGGTVRIGAPGPVCTGVGLAKREPSRLGCLHGGGRGAHP